MGSNGQLTKREQHFVRLNIKCNAILGTSRLIIDTLESDVTILNRIIEELQSMNTIYSFDATRNVGGRLLQEQIDNVMAISDELLTRVSNIKTVVSHYSNITIDILDALFTTDWESLDEEPISKMVHDILMNVQKNDITGLIEGDLIGTLSDLDDLIREQGERTEKASSMMTILGEVSSLVSNMMINQQALLIELEMIEQIAERG